MDTEQTTMKDVNGLVTSRAADKYWAEYAEEGVTKEAFDGWTWQADCSGLEVTLLSFNYEEIDPVSAPKLLDSSKWVNNEQLQNSETFSVNKSTTATFSWAITEGLKVTEGQSVSVKAPALVDEKVSVSIELSLSATETTTKSETQMWTSSVTVNIPPRSIIEARCLIEELTYSPRFTATVKLGGYVRVGMQKGNEKAFETYSVEDVVPPEEQVQTLRGIFKGVQGVGSYVEVNQFDLKGNPLVMAARL